MTRPPTVRRFLLILLVAIATLAAACGSDETDVDVAPEDPSGGGGPVVAEPSPGGAADEGEPAEAGTDPVQPSLPVELSASFRGVTADTIKVGVVAVDLESVRDFVDLDHGSYEAAYSALIEEVNRSGGVLGRRIEMVFDQYLPIGTLAMDTICTRFTQDEEVFAVLGGLQNDGPLCYTALNDTAMIGSTQNDRRLEKSTAPWFTGVRNSDAVLEVILRGFAREGVFDGAKVAVVAAIADLREVEDNALPLLTELGVEPVDVSFIQASVIDTVAAESEVRLITERQESEGADLVLAVGGGVAQYVGGLETVAYRPRVATTSLGSLRALIRDRSGRDLSLLEGSVAGNTAEQLGWWDDPAIQECIRIVEAAGEPTILDPNTRLVDEPENIVSVAAACRDVSLFVAIATAAGPDLTNESFAAAGADLGEFHVPGLGEALYGPDTPDGGVPVFFYEWDTELDDLRTDGTTL
jgi:hypothetical protein